MLPTKTECESSASPKLEPTTVIKVPPDVGLFDPPSIEISWGYMYEKAALSTPSVPATSILTFKPCPVPDPSTHLIIVFAFKNVTPPQDVLPIFAVTPAVESPMKDPKMDTVTVPLWKDAAKFGLAEKRTGEEYENAAVCVRI